MINQPDQQATTIKKLFRDLLCCLGLPGGAPWHQMQQMMITVQMGNTNPKHTWVGHETVFNVQPRIHNTAAQCKAMLAQLLMPLGKANASGDIHGLFFL